MSQGETLHQLSVGYDQIEDRLLLRMSTNQQREFLYLITRRLFVQLVTQFEKMEEAISGAGTHADPATREAVTEFHRNENLKQADFDSEYGNGMTITPVFEDGPKLLTAFEITLDGDVVHLSLVTRDDLRMVFPVLKNNFSAFRHLLANGGVQAEWVLVQDQAAPLPQLEESEKKTIH